jgi:hypothetical protein
MVMAEKKKPYERFEELTKRATAPTGAEARRGLGADEGSPPEQELAVWLSPEIRRALLERAATENTTASRIVEEALRRHFGR